MEKEKGSGRRTPEKSRQGGGGRQSNDLSGLASNKARRGKVGQGSWGTKPRVGPLELKRGKVWGRALDRVNFEKLSNTPPRECKEENEKI